MGQARTAFTLAVIYIGLTQFLYLFPVARFDIGTGASVFFPVVGASVAAAWIGGPWLCFAIAITTLRGRYDNPEQYLHVLRHVALYGGLGLLLRYLRFSPLALTARNASVILIAFMVASGISAGLAVLHYTVVQNMPAHRLADTLTSFWVGDAAGGILTVAIFAALFTSVVAASPLTILREHRIAIQDAIMAVVAIGTLAFILSGIGGLLTKSLHIWFLLSLAACGFAWWKGPITGAMAAILANALTVALFPQAMRTLPLLDLQLHMLAIGASVMLVGAAHQDQRRAFTQLVAREAEARRLARKNQLFAQALHASPVAVTIQDTESCDVPIFTNPAFEKLGIPVCDLGTDSPLHDDQAEQDLRVTRSDGQQRQIKVQVAPVVEDNGGKAGVVCVYTDETEALARIRVEKQAERLRALGFLAGGIAHEINNLLHPIQNLGSKPTQSIEIAVEM